MKAGGQVDSTAALKAELREIADQLQEMAGRLAGLHKAAQRLSRQKETDPRASEALSALEAAIGCVLIDRIRPAVAITWGASRARVGGGKAGARRRRR